MEVEVVFPRVCGAFYQAFIQDVQLDGGKAYLTFPKDWKPPVWADLSCIRFPMDAAATALENFNIGSKVEALLPHHDNEPAGWWTGTLLKSRGELHVVEFQSGTEKYQDIVDHDKLRLPNTSMPLSKIKMYRKEFQMVDELDDYCQRRGVHENFRSKIKALCVSYDHNNRILVVLASSEACLDRAGLLIDMHIKDLLTQKSLLSKSDLAAQRFYHHQNHQGVEPGVKEIRFHVPSDLVGMAIGRDGANVNEARRIPGVTSVEFDDYSSMFSVKGENEDALIKARERLEFGREMMLIPRNLAGKVIGKKGNVIQQILEKSRVHNVKVVGDDEAKERDIDVQAQVPFDFIGRKIDIDNAKMMMEYHLEHLRSVEKILQSRELEGTPTTEETYFPAPPRGQRGRGRHPPRAGGSRGRLRDSQTTDDGQNSPLSLEPATDRRQSGREDSDSDSDNSNAEQEGSGNVWKSGSDDDDLGPDRRRQLRGPPGGGGGGRGGGNPRRGGRGGRGGGRGGHGYRNQRHGSSNRNRYADTGGGRGSGPEGSTDSRVPGATQATTGQASGGQDGVGASPRPQRQNRGRQQGGHSRKRGGSGNRLEEGSREPQSEDSSNKPHPPSEQAM